MAELPEDLCAPLVAHFLKGESHAQIAKDLDVSRQTISHRIARGVDSIRHTLRKRGIPIATPALAAMMQTGLADAAPSPPRSNPR